MPTQKTRHQFSLQSKTSPVLIYFPMKVGVLPLLLFIWSISKLVSPLDMTTYTILELYKWPVWSSGRAFKRRWAKHGFPLSSHGPLSTLWENKTPSCHIPPKTLNGAWIVWNLAPASVKTGWGLYERLSGFVKVVRELWPNFLRS